MKKRERTPKEQANYEAHSKPMSQPEAEAMTRTALEYIAAGLSIIPVKTDHFGDIKIPAAATWDTYKVRPIKAAEFLELIGKQMAWDWRGVGVIGGPASGGFECIDIDVKADPTGQIADTYLALVKDNAPDLFTRLVIATTPSGGTHIYYRRDYKHADPTEKQGGLAFITTESGAKGPALIETRILGGYAVAPPTQGRAFTQGHILALPVLTEDERALLFGLARSLSQYTEPPKKEYQPSTRKLDTFQGERPGDHYNRETRIEDLLAAAGWEIQEPKGNRTQVVRPGASSETSGNIMDGKLWIWSTGAGLPHGEALSPFALFAHLHHRGDYAAAARELRRLGYGAPQPGDIRPQQATISTITQGGELVRVAGPGELVAAIEITKGADIVYIDHPADADAVEIWGHIKELDTATGPDIMVRQVDPETGEAGEAYLSTRWILSQIIEPYQAKQEAGNDLTDEDQANILARIAKAVRVTKNGVARSRLLEAATRWPGWDALGVRADALMDRLDAAAREAAKEERVQRLDMALEDVLDARQDNNAQKLGEALRRLELAAIDRQMIAPVHVMETEGVKHQLKNRNSGISTGWNALDKAGIRLRPGCMIAVGARTNNGKTAFMVNMAVRAAINYPDRVFYYLIYEENAVDLYDKLISLVAGVEWKEDEIREALHAPDKAKPELLAAIEAVDALTDNNTGRLRIIDNRPTLEATHEFMQEQERRGVKIGGLFIDYATKAKVEGKHEGIRERVIHVSEVVQEIALGLDIPVIIAAQLSREAAGKPPELDHFKESGSIEEGAALAFLLWATDFDKRNLPDATAEPHKSASDLQVYMSKTRRMGKGGVKLRFDGPTQQILDNGKPKSMVPAFAELVKNTSHNKRT